MLNRFENQCNHMNTLKDISRETRFVGCKIYSIYSKYIQFVFLEFFKFMLNVLSFFCLIVMTDCVVLFFGGPLRAIKHYLIILRAYFISYLCAAVM